MTLELTPERREFLRRAAEDVMRTGGPDPQVMPEHILALLDASETTHQRVMIASLALQQIATSGDLATIHALANNTLEHMRRGR